MKSFEGKINIPLKPDQALTKIPTLILQLLIGIGVPLQYSLKVPQKDIKKTYTKFFKISKEVCKNFLRSS
jgi:hypothetical protein